MDELLEKMIAAKVDEVLESQQPTDTPDGKVWGIKDFCASAAVEEAATGCVSISCTPSATKSGSSTIPSTDGCTTRAR